ALPTRATVRLDRLKGQPRPWQRTVMVAPYGAFTVNRLIRAPCRPTLPEIRTIGNGLNRPGADGPPSLARGSGVRTESACVTVEVGRSGSSVSVTRRLTW